MSFTTFLLQTTDAGAAATGGGLGMLIPLILIVVIMYFFMIRPQNKKQKETQKMLDALKKGDKVITIGGIHGVVAQTKEQTVVIKVEDGTKIEFNRTAISTVVSDKPAATEATEKKKGLFGFKKKAASQIKDEKESADSEKASEESQKDAGADESAKVESAQSESNSAEKVESGDKKDE